MFKEILLTRPRFYGELEFNIVEVKTIVHKALLKTQLACHASTVALEAHVAAGELEFQAAEQGGQEGASTDLLAVSGDALISGGEKVNFLREWKAMFQEHCLQHYLDEPEELNSVDILPHYLDDGELNSVDVNYIINVVLPKMEPERQPALEYIAVAGLDEVLQRCDKNMLVAVVARLCVMFQTEHIREAWQRLDLIRGDPQRQERRLDLDVKVAIYEALFETQVAEKRAQDKDHDAFTVVRRTRTAAAACLGDQGLACTGLLAVGRNVLSLISTFLHCEKMELLREWDATGEGDVGSCHMSSCTSMVLSSAGNDLHLRNAASGVLTNTFKGHTNIVRECRFFPDEKTVVSASYDRTLKVWDVASGSLVRTLVGHPSSVLCVDVSPDNARILSCSIDGTWNLWNSRTGELQRTLHAHTDTYILQYAESEEGASWCCSFSPNGSLFLVGCYSNLKLYDATTYQVQRTFTGHDSVVRCCSFAPDGATILSSDGSVPGMMALWSATTGQRLRTLGGHTAAVSSLSFSPSGNEICSASDDGMLMVWAVATGHLEGIVDADDHVSPTDYRGKTPLSVCASSDGKNIVSSQYGGAARIWRVLWRGSVK
jgi:hypothetical protein